MVGLGFGGVPSGDALDEIEQAFAARGSAAQVELSNLADPAIGAALTHPGLPTGVVRERAWGRPPARAICSGRCPPSGVEVRLSDDRAAWLDIVVEGSAHPDTEGVRPTRTFRARSWKRRTGTSDRGRHTVSRVRGGVVAGGASMRISEGVAQLAGAATAPAHRRRGVQTALLSARLADAARAGCDVAVVTTQPGSKSQQNVQRRGFQLLYTRAVLVDRRADPSPLVP